MVRFLYNDDISLTHEQGEDIKSLTKKKVSRRCVSLPVFIISVLIAAVIAFGGAILLLNSTKARRISFKLNEIDALVNKYYTGELDYEEIDNAVLSAYMKAIEDKYSFYKSKDEAEAVSDSFEGNTNGIGITVYYKEEENALAVFRVDKDSPAYKAGIQIGDLIVSIDSNTVEEIGYSDSVKAIKRELGQTVDLGIIRNQQKINLSVLYEEFIRQTVYTEQYGDIGYICFTNFNDATVAQFNQAMDDFEQSGIKGIVFDVRDNGGGTVDSVCKILDRLVGECNLMTVEYANGEKRVTHTSDKNETNIPMAVLVNSNTASASELFVATLKHEKNAPLVGNKTYGKGVMQRTYFLQDNSCVRFTVGKFFPSSGESFNEVGLIPDFEVSFTEEQLEESYTLGQNDPYLKKALELIK